MRNYILAALAVMFVGFFGFGSTAEAGEYCKTVNECKRQVASLVGGQDSAARGRQWGPVGHSACEIASREQEGNERRCRSYDAKPGGKTLAECAKCYRQVREDLARWEQCYKAGFAPKPPRAIYDSLARLGRSAEVG